MTMALLSSIAILFLVSTYAGYWIGFNLGILPVKPLIIVVLAISATSGIIWFAWSAVGLVTGAVLGADDRNTPSY